MTPDQAVGYALIQSTAVSNIVNGRVYYATKPTTEILPSINYYDLPHKRINGLKNPIFSINCRAGTARAARDLGTVVLEELTGTQGQGKYGTVNGPTDDFDFIQNSLITDNGVKNETENCFNCPIDIMVITNE